MRKKKDEDEQSSDEDGSLYQEESNDENELLQDSTGTSVRLIVSDIYTESEDDIIEISSSD